MKVVRDLLRAYEKGDAKTIASLLAPDASIRLMAMRPDPAKTGKEVAEQAASMFNRGTSIKFEVLHTIAEGPIVVNRRVDRITDQTGNHCAVHGLKGIGTCADQIVGVFLLKDGKIKDWLDLEVADTVPEKRL